MLDPNNTKRDMPAMTNNMIGHSKGLRKEIINLASKIRNSSTNVNRIKRIIVCIKEFCNKFNPCNSNNTNNSITLQVLSIFLIDSTIDSKEHVQPVATGHKHKENVLVETHCNNTLNKIIDPNNNKIFYCTELKEFVGIVTHTCDFIADQPGKRNCASQVGVIANAVQRSDIAAMLKTHVIN